MKKLIKTLVVAGSVLLAGSAMAQQEMPEGLKLMKGSDCFTCHRVNMKLVGPSYQDVAKKYKGNAEAVKTLVAKVKKGGSGVWGAAAMTPHPQFTDEQLTKMVEWILALPVKN